MAVRRPRTASGWAIASIWLLFIVMWIGGVTSYVLWGGVRAGDEWAAPVFLAVAGLLVLAATGMPRACAFLAAGLVGFLFEWIGLSGGWLFSEYAYTDVLAPRLAGVPLVMASAWMVLAAYVHDLLADRRWPPGARIVAGAALLTTIDLVIDPLASGPLGYWQWALAGAFHGVPARNFAGWFAVGAVTLTLLHVVAPGGAGHRTTRAVGLSIVLFFTVLAVSFGLMASAGAGVAVCAVHLWLSRAGVRRGPLFGWDPAREKRNRTRATGPGAAPDRAG